MDLAPQPAVAGNDVGNLLIPDRVRDHQHGVILFCAVHVTDAEGQLIQGLQHTLFLIFPEGGNACHRADVIHVQQRQIHLIHSLFLIQGPQPHARHGAKSRLPDLLDGLLCRHLLPGRHRAQKELRLALISQQKENQAVIPGVQAGQNALPA